MKERHRGSASSRSADSSSDVGEFDVSGRVFKWILLTFTAHNEYPGIHGGLYKNELCVHVHGCIRLLSFTRVGHVRSTGS